MTFLDQEVFSGVTCEIWGKIGQNPNYWQTRRALGIARIYLRQRCFDASKPRVAAARVAAATGAQ